MKVILLKIQIYKLGQMIVVSIYDCPFICLDNSLVQVFFMFSPPFQPITYLSFSNLFSTRPTICTCISLFCIKHNTQFISPTQLKFNTFSYLCKKYNQPLNLSFCSLLVLTLNSVLSWLVPLAHWHVTFNLICYLLQRLVSN